MSEVRELGPIGIKPERFWRMERVQALVDTIGRYVNHYDDQSPPHVWESVRKWADEVVEHNRWIEAELKAFKKEVGEE